MNRKIKEDSLEGAVESVGFGQGTCHTLCTSAPPVPEPALQSAGVYLRSCSPRRKLLGQVQIHNLNSKFQRGTPAKKTLS